MFYYIITYTFIIGLLLKELVVGYFSLVIVEVIYIFLVKVFSFILVF